MSQLYVGNLAVKTTENELDRLFRSHGRVRSVRIEVDIDTGRGRGFATVEMNDDTAASNAIRALDGQELGGQTLRVSPAVGAEVPC